jgi:hypothetical protein
MAELVTPEEQRSFASSHEAGSKKYELAVRLPAKLAGGYWRTPGALQIAFWEKQRASFSLSAPGTERVEAEVECVAVSADGIRMVTTGTTPDVLVRFEECQ